jgi:hypothetical protein
MNLELLGFVIILLAMGGCSFDLALVNSGWGLGVGFSGFLVGLVVFIAGRFQRKPGGES